MTIIIPEKTSESSHCDICLTSHGAGGFSCISQDHTFYIPLHYIILFPHSESGWYWGMTLQKKYQTQIRLAQCAYY